jgi:hypothetical protein
MLRELPGRPSIRRPSRRTIRRLVLVSLPLLVVASATPTLGALTGVITGHGTNTAGSLVLTTTPSGGTTCTSTGGTNTPFTSDTSSCSGSALPASELSSSSSSSLATTFASVGTTGPSGATLATGAGPGTEVAPDASGNGDDAFPLDGVTFGASGPLSASAAAFNGSNGVLETEQEVNDPGPSYTLAAWFKVANGYSSGGGIIGFQNLQGIGAASDVDRKLWMDNSGHICAGEYTTGGQTEIATSAGSTSGPNGNGTYNNGSWHFVVASFSSSSGLTIYVDGTSVGTNSAATSGQNYAGWWTIGYEYETGGAWSPVPSSLYLNGSLAEVAVFPSALIQSQVTTLYNSGSGSESSFETRALADTPSQFWPLQSASRTTNLPAIAKLPDISTNNNLGTPQGGVSQIDSGPISGSGSMYFDGASNAYVETATSNSALPSSFSLAVWFRAPKGLSTGGGIMSFDSAQAGGGPSHDPLVWMDNSGKIVVGTWAGAAQEATSSASYNDGNWHLLVATVSSGGLKLYIDGSLITTNASGTSGGAGGGYWLIGYSNEASWSDAPTDLYWTGDIAHAAFFPSALTGGTGGQISTLDQETSASAFETQMLADSPTYYWPLTDSGTTESENWPFFQVVPDYSGKNDDATAVGSTVTLGAAGNYSSSFAGAFTGSSGFLETSNQLASPSSFSLVAWFKAPSHSTGGMIVGFNSAQNGTGANHDRMIWMDNSGNIVAGFWNGSQDVEAKSAATYDNNAWHLVVASFTPTLVTLYVDNAAGVPGPSGSAAPTYNGYWVLGYSSIPEWSDAPSDLYWDGELADVAVIPSTLSSGTVTTLYGESTQAQTTSEITSSLLATQYWTLGDAASAPTDAGAIEMSVQAANNGATSCLFPNGTGNCPALAESDLRPLATSWSPAVPTAAYSTTVTIAAQEASAAPAGFAGLYFVVPLTFSGTLGSWTAALAYAAANFEL